MQDAFTPARRSKTSGPALAGAGAGEAASAGAAPSPPNGPAGRAEDRPAAAVAAPAASSAPGSPPAITGLSGAVAGASPLAAGAAAVVATASAGAVGSPPSPPPPGARCLSESDALLAGAAASLSAESSSSGLGTGGATTAASEPGSLQGGLHHAKSAGTLGDLSSEPRQHFCARLCASGLAVHLHVAGCNGRTRCLRRPLLSTSTLRCRLLEVVYCPEAAGCAVARSAALVAARGVRLRMPEGHGSQQRGLCPAARDIAKLCRCARQ